MFFDFGGCLGKGMIRPEIGDGALQGTGIGATTDAGRFGKGAKELAAAAPPVGLFAYFDFAVAGVPVESFFCLRVRSWRALDSASSFWCLR